MQLPVLGIDIAKKSYEVTLRGDNKLQRHSFVNQVEQFQELSAWQAQQGLKQQRDLLVSIPGIGNLTAAKLLSENIQAFSSTRALVAYAGLSPQSRRSGTSHPPARMSKIGNPHLRKALYFPAVNARRFNPVIQIFCERLRQRDKHTMTIIGAAMRKLLCLALGVLKSGVPFDPNYQSLPLPA